MEEFKFNLIDEPWIPVTMSDGSEKEFSLRDVFRESKNVLGLSSEMEALNASILRLLLGILHPVVVRNDESGSTLNYMDKKALLERWEQIWQNGELPVGQIDQYLDQYHERFWLFHPDHPFYQSDAAKAGTAYKAGKLFGDLSESSNKIRLFQNRSLSGKEKCSYPEAARWLLFLISYDDTSSKPHGKGLPSCGAGWLGKIGQVYAKGRNLFETLMLNLVLLQPSGKPWKADKPIWETETAAQERKEIAPPDNFSQLMTIPSRWISLKEEDGYVTGYSLLGGEFFQKDAMTAEPFTLWRTVQEKKNAPVHFSPRRHDGSRELWQDFSSLVPVSQEEGAKLTRIPGISSWIETLIEEDILDEEYPLSITRCAVLYGDKDFFVVDNLGDGISLQAGLLSDASLYWRDGIEEEIEKLDKLAYYTGDLAWKIQEASGNSGEQVRIHSIESGKEKLYSAAGPKFKLWLSDLNPLSDDLEEKRNEWHQTVRKIARNVSRELIRKAADTAAFGRLVTDANKNSKLLYLPEVEDEFAGRLYYLYGKEVKDDAKSDGGN